MAAVRVCSVLRGRARVGFNKDMQGWIRWARFSSWSVLIWGALLLFNGCARSPQAIRDRSLASGMKLMQKGDYRRALLEFKNAVQAMPRDAEAQYQLGNALV